MTLSFLLESSSLCHAEWRTADCLLCAHGLWVTGTVVDPKWDGWCAQVEAVFNHISYYSAEACGPGHDETFTLPPDNESPAKASPVDVYLQTVCGKTCKSEGRGRKLVYRH